MCPVKRNSPFSFVVARALGNGNQEAPLAEHDRRAADRLLIRRHRPPGDDPLVVQGDIDVPKNRQGGNGAEGQGVAVAEPGHNRLPHPLAAPVVSPAMNSFWASRKRIRPGRRTMIQKAYRAPVVSSTTVRNRDNPRGRVCIS